MKNKYFISGLGPGEAGASRLVSMLSITAREKGWKVLYPYKHKSLTKLYEKKAFYPLVKEILKRIVFRPIFVLKILTIRNSNVILLHPQTLGINHFIRLVEKNHDVRQYVLDNSFFCIESYNFLDGHECTLCLNDLDRCDEKCKSFPIRYKKEKNIILLRKYMELSSKVSFFTQNKFQEKLVRSHFGENNQVTTIGMFTGEVRESEYKEDTGNYILYHGSESESKGILYFIELAKYLKEYEFVIPHIKHTSYPTLPNITYTPCGWESGLKNLVQNAALVINPSLWSAPIEGALLKSMAFNKKVAVVKTMYGFVNEIPDHLLLKLDNNNISIDATQIKDYINEKNILQDDWLSNFLRESRQNISILFADKGK